MTTSQGIDRSGGAGGSGVVVNTLGLSDPNKDALPLWNDSAGQFDWIGFTDGDTPTDGAFVVGDGTNWVKESGATARASLGSTSVGDAVFIAANAAAAAAALAVLPLSGGTLTGGLVGTTATFSGAVDVSGAAAGQIKFPATQNASADANTLDDYEEGTWTPSVGGTATYGDRSGHYTKIGRTVIFRGTINITLIGTGSTTTISGLPFTSGFLGPVAVGPLTGAATAIVSIVGRVNGATIDLHSRTGAATSDAVNAIFANGTFIEFGGSYQI